MRANVAVAVAALAVVAAVGLGLASGRVLRPPPPTPVRVNVIFTPAPTPSPTPYDEAAFFRQPLSGGCATAAGVWIITNGGGLLRYDGAEWAQVDSTLRSLTRAACSAQTAFAVGLIGTLVIGDELSLQISATDITIDDLFGVSPLPAGALIVGSRGSVFILDNGAVQPYARGLDEDLFDVIAFSVQSAWAVGDRGITYRLDARGWAPVGSGQKNTLRAIAGTTPANVVAVGDSGTIVTYAGGWHTAKSGVDVALRDVIVEPGLWIAGDAGTLLTTSGSPAELFRRVDLGTTCDLVSLFARGDEVWVVGRGPTSGGVWRLRGDGSVSQHFGGC